MKIKIVLFLAMIFLSLSFGTAKAEISAEEQKVIDLINDYRRENKLTELKPTKSVQAGAEYMAESFAHAPNGHIDDKGRDLNVRALAFGFHGYTENIGWRALTGEGIFEAWKNSVQGHKENMMTKGGRTIGVGHYYEQGLTKDGLLTEDYWVMDISDGGVERLKGNKLKSNEFADGKQYKKLSITATKKKNGKRIAAKGVYLKVYDASSGRLLDHDITDKKGKASLYTALSPSKIKIRVYKTKWKKNASKIVKKKWTKSIKYKTSI